LPQNYKMCCWFGKYPPGSILPAHEVEIGCDYAHFVEKGFFEPTDLPVNVPIAPPDPVKEPVPDKLLAVTQERDRLADENDKLRKAAQHWEGYAKEREKERDALQKQCDAYTLENGHLKNACEDHQRAIDKLQADLDAAKKAPATT